MNCRVKRREKETDEQRKEREEREELVYLLAGRHVYADCCHS